MFSPCLVIPVYNHGTLIAATLARLQSLSLPCLIVDDGSDQATAQVLEQLAAERDWVTLYRYADNRGKGVAVLHGIAQAQRLGYSHAVQVDADGQHELEKIPALLAMAEQTPSALISGAPIYDDSIPRVRFYGRYITHFCVWAETLSFSIVDSMCGFRVYPVAATNELASRTPIGRRMDFDTDIMVRLYWRGTPVRFLPTKVHYPADGVSHFAPVADNARISWMHIRLLLGMLLRLPLLLWRKCSPPDARAAPAGKEEGQHWSQRRESGVYLAMSTAVLGYRLLGRTGMRLLLYPIIGYFYLKNGAARRASRSFLQRVYAVDNSGQAAFAKAPGRRESFAHFMNFGRAIVDRIASWVGDLRREDVVFENRQMLLDCIAEGRGGMILSSHLGNAEVCRALVDRVANLKMNVLVFNDNAKQINRLMKKFNPRADLELIQIATVDPGTAMLLNQKIQHGEFVIIAADRTSPTAPEKSVHASFMGSKAAFPQGAFILAGLLNCPVFLLFCLERGHYQIHLEKFADSMPMPRKQRAQLLQEHVQRYASRLEHYALQAPLQWYNFFDFWAEAASVEAGAAPPAELTARQSSE